MLPQYKQTPIVTDESLPEIMSQIESSPRTKGNSDAKTYLLKYPLIFETMPQLNMSGKMFFTIYNHSPQIIQIKYVVEPPLVSGGSMFVVVRNIYRKYFNNSANVGHFVYHTKNMAHMAPDDIIMEMLQAHSKFRNRWMDTCEMINTKIYFLLEEKEKELESVRSQISNYRTAQETINDTLISDRIFALTESERKLLDIVNACKYDMTTVSYLKDTIKEHSISINASDKITIKIVDGEVQ